MDQHARMRNCVHVGSYTHCIHIGSTHAAKKKKWIRGNHKQHMNKSLRKATRIYGKSKQFWNVCKPYYTNKRSRCDTSIMLPEKEFDLSEKKTC